MCFSGNFANVDWRSAMTIPRPRLVVTYGNTVSYTEYSTSTGTWPIANTLHLLTDNCNCHVEAHSTIKSRAPCNITVSDTFTICKYTLTPSANNFTIIPWLSYSFTNSSTSWYYSWFYINQHKKLSSLKRGVRAINHTYKTAQNRSFLWRYLIDHCGCSYKPRLPDPILNVWTPSLFDEQLSWYI